MSKCQLGSPGCCLSTKLQHGCYNASLLLDFTSTKQHVQGFVTWGKWGKRRHHREQWEVINFTSKFPPLFSVKLSNDPSAEDFAKLCPNDTRWHYKATTSWIISIAWCCECEPKRLWCSTCLDNWAVMTWEKLWPKWIIRIAIIFTKFQLWAHKPSVNWVCGHSPSSSLPRVNELMLLSRAAFLSEKLKMSPRTVPDLYDMPPSCSSRFRVCLIMADLPTPDSPETHQWVGPSVQTLVNSEN